MSRYSAAGRFINTSKHRISRLGPGWLVLVSMGTSLLLAGCGPANELGRLPFSGTVTLNGEPLEQGSISLTPVDPSKGATRSGAPITNGKFSVDTHSGLPPGEYVVRINAASTQRAKVAKDQPPGAPPPLAKELIPPEYNSNSDKTATIAEDKENHFTFNITTNG